MDYYRGLLQYRPRIEAFQRAIADSVGPDDVVLEIGTGLGTFAMFAARAGAKRVWAVDGHPIVHVARTIARINECDERVNFVRGWVPDVDIGERANVLIFEDFPLRWLDRRTHELLQLVVKNCLTDDARVVPQRGRVLVAPVSSTEEWDVCGEFGDAGDTDFGIDWMPSREYVLNSPLSRTLKSESLLSDPVQLFDVPLLPVPAAESLGGKVTFEAGRAGDMHGIAYWFDLGFAAGDYYSNHPGKGATWGQLLLPLDRAVAIDAGQTIEVEVRPESLAGGAPGWLTWKVSTGDYQWSGHEFKSFAATERDLQYAFPGATPRLTSLAAAESVVLSLVDGHRTIDEIVAEVARMTGLDEDMSRRTVGRALHGRTE